MNKKQIYGYFSDNYYMVDDASHVVITDNMDYKTSAIQTELHDEMKTCTINLYQYYSDLLTESNSDRVGFMKDYLIDNKVKTIQSVNHTDYCIIVSYRIWNKDGALIKCGTEGSFTKNCVAIINSNIDDNNEFHYRKGYVFDGEVTIDIPEISRYGIKNQYIQHPYTIRIDRIKVVSTIKDTYKVDPHDIPDHAGAMHYHFTHRPKHMAHNNFNSPFITNAKVGTTLIDHMVFPVELEIGGESDEVVLCDIKLQDTQTVKLNKSLNSITLKMEVLLDNYNQVYDSDDIKTIIDLNNVEDEDNGDVEVPEEPGESVDEPNETPKDPVKETPEEPGENIDDPNSTPQDPVEDNPEQPSESVDGSDDVTQDAGEGNIEDIENVDKKDEEVSNGENIETDSNVDSSESIIEGSGEENTDTP